METLGLRRRVSTRASLACSPVHISTPNPSVLSSSSRTTAPIAMSPELFDSTNRSHLRSIARSSPSFMTLDQQCLSISSLPSVPPSAQITSCGDGQFSDADTEDDPTELREKKRLKLDCFRSTKSFCPQAAGFSARRGTSPNLPHGLNPSHGVDHPKNSGIKKVTTSGLACASRGRQEGVNTDFSSTKNSKTNVTSNLFSPSDSRSQLPMATRRLAMLVGIPESSQAIIQSTLSLPFSRINTPGRTHSHSNASRNVPFASIPKQFDAITPVPSSHRSRSSHNDGTPVDLPAVSPITSSKRIAECEISSISRINPALVANNDSRSPARCSSNISENVVSPNTLADFTGNSTDALTAPRYGKTSNSSHDFTMPAPGTFSIRAPSSSQILRSFSSATSLETSESENHRLNKLEKCKEGSENDEFSQATSTYRAASLDDGTTHTAMTPATSVADGTEGRKRKARANKAKSTSQLGRSESAESGVELVKPPPTINGKISHARKVPPGYVKRTPNSFLMFRSHVIANKLLPPGVENDNRQISRVVSGLWAGLSEDDLRTWQEASRELRAAVRAKNPGLKHAPNQKRKEVIRRRRNGQLPGETPEQRVEREKAAAAALAKVIMESRGEKLDKDKLVKLASLSTQPSTSNASINSRETSRPEFRAPTYHFSNSTLMQGITPRSEYAESNLTHSPIPEPRRSLSCVPEIHGDALPAQKIPLTPKTMTPGRPPEKPVNDCQRSMDQSPQPKPASCLLEHDQKRDIQPDPPSSLDLISPEIKSQQPSMSPKSPQATKKLSNHPPEADSSSNIFLALGLPSRDSQSFPDTFSNEMLRSLGLIASDIDLDLSASDPQLPVTSSTLNNPVSSSKCFSSEVDKPGSNSGFWPHETRFSNLVNFSPTQYPFRDLALSEGMSSQDTSVGNDDDSCTVMDSLSQVEKSNPLEMSSLINDCYNEPLNCDGLNFDSLYLNCTPNSIPNLDLEESRQAFSTNLFETHLNHTIEESNPIQANTLWNRNDS